MQKGFIQIPILIGIVVVAILGGGALVVYEAKKPPQNAIQKEVVGETEVKATTSAEISASSKAEQKTESKADKENALLESLKTQVADLAQKIGVPKIETPKTSVMTLPSGAVVEMDANGNIIRTITEAPQSNTFQANTGATETLSLSLEEVKVIPSSPCCAYSVYISWSTNLPATSKVFLTKRPSGATNKNVSSAKLSTTGSVNFSNLTEKAGYSYTIEVIAGTQVQKITGAFSAATIESGTITVYPSQ